MHSVLFSHLVCSRQPALSISLNADTLTSVHWIPCYEHMMIRTAANRLACLYRTLLILKQRLVCTWFVAAGIYVASEHQMNTLKACLINGVAVRNAVQLGQYLARDNSVYLGFTSTDPLGNIEF